MMDEEKEQTPQEVLMNCIADADRLKEIVVIAFTNDGYYEYWSNNLPVHIRLGLIKIAEVRMKNTIETTVDEP